MSFRGTRTGQRDKQYACNMERWRHNEAERMWETHGFRTSTNSKSSVGVPLLCCSVSFSFATTDTAATPIQTDREASMHTTTKQLTTSSWNLAKLKTWGKTQREATQHCKSNCLSPRLPIRQAVDYKCEPPSKTSWWNWNLVSIPSR